MNEKLTRFIVIAVMLAAFIMVLSAAAQDDPTAVEKPDRAAAICLEQGGRIIVDWDQERLVGECVVEEQPVCRSNPFTDGKCPDLDLPEKSSF